jgi:transcriptional regulator
MMMVASLRAEGLTSSEIASALKMHEYRVSMILRNDPKVEICRNMLKRCHEADLDVKRSRDGYSAIEKLICTI